MWLNNDSSPHMSGPSITTLALLVPCQKSLIVSLLIAPQQFRRARCSRQGGMGKGGRRRGAGRGADNDCVAACGGAATRGAFLRGGMGTAWDGGGSDIFFLMSCSIGCRVAMLPALCSCL